MSQEQHVAGVLGVQEKVEELIFGQDAGGSNVCTPDQKEDG